MNSKRKINIGKVIRRGYHVKNLSYGTCWAIMMDTNLWSKGGDKVSKEPCAGNKQALDITFDQQTIRKLTGLNIVK